MVSSLPLSRLQPLTGPTKRHGSSQHNPYVDPLPVPPNPTFLPFKIQHIFYNTIQRLLEEACFYFAERHCPDLLRAQGWDTPEAGEFNQWWGVIRGSRIPAHFVKVSPGLNMNALFTRLHTVRHSAVHRLQTEMEGLKYMIEDAVTLASVLRDDLRRNKLRSIELELHGGDLDKLQNIIEKPLNEFADFKFPGRSLAPRYVQTIEVSQRSYRSRSNERTTQIRRRSQSPRACRSKDTQPSVTRKPKRVSKSLPAGSFTIDLTALSDEEDQEKTNSSSKDQIIDLTSDTEDERPKNTTVRKLLTRATLPAQTSSTTLPPQLPVKRDDREILSVTDQNIPPAPTTTQKNPFAGVLEQGLKQAIEDRELLSVTDQNVPPVPFVPSTEKRPFASLIEQGLKQAIEDQKTIDTLHENSSSGSDVHQALSFGHDFINLN